MLWSTRGASSFATTRADGARRCRHGPGLSALRRAAASRRPSPDHQPSPRSASRTPSPRQAPAARHVATASRIPAAPHDGAATAPLLRAAARPVSPSCFDLPCRRSCSWIDALRRNDESHNAVDPHDRYDDPCQSSTDKARPPSTRPMTDRNDPYSVIVAKDEPTPSARSSSLKPRSLFRPVPKRFAPRRPESANPTVGRNGSADHHLGGQRIRIPATMSSTRLVETGRGAFATAGLSARLTPAYETEYAHHRSWSMDGMSGIRLELSHGHAVSRSRVSRPLLG